jgi:hypothetical protein
MQEALTYFPADQQLVRDTEMVRREIGQRQARRDADRRAEEAMRQSITTFVGRFSQEPTGPALAGRGQGLDFIGDPNTSPASQRAAEIAKQEEQKRKAEELALAEKYPAVNAAPPAPPIQKRQTVVSGVKIALSDSA